jgi:predicted Co/Zn/Cd cation transporter (cation efflux family)
MIGSQAIMFDGMYSFVDVILASGALAVSKLLTQEPTRRWGMSRSLLNYVGPALPE